MSSLPSRILFLPIMVTSMAAAAAAADPVAFPGRAGPSWHGGAAGTLVPHSRRAAPILAPPWARPDPGAPANGREGLATLPNRQAGAAATPETDRPFHERLATWRDRFGAAFPLMFIVLFVLNTVACLPAGVMTLAGGFLFGPFLGFLYVWTGAMIGASAAFGISRHLGRDWIRRRLVRRPLLAAIEQAVSDEGWKVVVLTRLAPGSPFFLLNYLFGLTRIRFRDYLWSTAVSVIPGSFLIVYLGSLGHLAVSGRIRSPAEWALYGAGLVALVGAVWLIARRARLILDRTLDSTPPKQAAEDHPPTDG